MPVSVDATPLTLESLFENAGEFVSEEMIEEECKRWAECSSEEWLKGADGEFPILIVRGTDGLYRAGREVHRYLEYGMCFLYGFINCPVANTHRNRNPTTGQGPLDVRPIYVIDTYLTPSFGRADTLRREQVMSFANLTSAVGEKRAELDRGSETLQEGLSTVTDNLAKLATKK